MAAMRVSASNSFDADPSTTHAMLTDADFLAAVCVASGDLAHRVEATPTRSAVERRMSSPSAVRRLLGDTLTLLQDVRWQPGQPDGARTGELTLTVQGMPARAEVAIDLRSGGRGTVVAFEGEFTINVPLLGRSLEKQAAPALLAGFDVQQEVGDEWLARDRT